MSVMEIDDNLNVRTMGKYFKNVFKAANYNEDITVKFPEGAHVDLAGLQILYAVKKELDKNMKKAKDCVQYMIDEKTLAHDSYIFGKYEEGQRINIKYKEVNSKIIFKNALEFNEILKRYKSDIKNISDVNEIRDMDSYIQAA